MKKALVWLALGGLFFSAHHAEAQRIFIPEEIVANIQSFNYFFKQGELTIQSTVVGPVGQPGVYIVPVGTDLGELFDLAGGINLPPRASNQSRRITFRLYRNVEGSRSVIYESDFDEFVGSPGAYPEIQDGDLLHVDVVVKTGFSWRDALSVVTTASALVILIERIANL